MPSSKSTTAEVARVLRQHSFSFKDEEQLQRGIAEALTAAGAPFSREVVLDARSRIDFMVAAACNVGIEVKVAGGASAVWSQIRRYFETGKVDGVVIVTTQRTHRLMYKEFDGKPIEVVWLGFSAL